MSDFPAPGAGLPKQQGYYNPSEPKLQERKAPAFQKMYGFPRRWHCAEFRHMPAVPGAPAAGKPRGARAFRPSASAGGGGVSGGGRTPPAIL